MLNFTDTHSRAILANSKYIAIPYIVSLLKSSASKRSLDWFIFLGSFTYTSINPSPWNVVAKIVLHPPEKKEKDEQYSCLVKKKEKKGKVYSATHKTTMEYILIYHLHLTHEMSI